MHYNEGHRVTDTLKDNGTGTTEQVAEQSKKNSTAGGIDKKMIVIETEAEKARKCCTAYMLLPNSVLFCLPVRSSLFSRWYFPCYWSCCVHHLWWPHVCKYPIPCPPYMVLRPLYLVLWPLYLVGIPCFWYTPVHFTWSCVHLTWCCVWFIWRCVPTLLYLVVVP